ncbi:hypothetical protein ACOMHN_007749 [Nucella lapillus]
MPARILAAARIVNSRCDRSTILSLSGIDEQVQAKCDSLRSSFTRELRKVKNSKKSGAGTDEVYVSSWCFYQQLQFLRAVIQIMKPRSTNMVSV